MQPRKLSGESSYSKGKGTQEFYCIRMKAVVDVEVRIRMRKGWIVGLVWLSFRVLSLDL